MKTIVWVLLGLMLAQQQLHAQLIDPKRRARQAAENRVNRRVDEGIDKGLDKIEEGIGGIFRKKKGRSEKGRPAEIPAASSGSGGSDRGNGALSQGTDFVPGNRLIFSDDFSGVAKGDFPVQWNTNGSGAVVTIEGQEGRWLSVVHNTVIQPVLGQPLPEHATIEFDLFLKAGGQQSTPFIQFGLAPVSDILKENIFYANRFFINLNRYAESDGQTLEYGLKNDVLGNKNDFPLTRYRNRVLHVAIALNGTRIRLYLDQQKIIDLPRALSKDMYRSFFLNNNQVIPASEIPMLIGNFRIAATEQDARSKLADQLIKEGVASTTEIRFDVNSDIIRPESHPVINEIGAALVAHPALKIRITGHTDGDGTAAANLELSRRRAAAVKSYLTENYPVAGSSIQTEGLGENRPVASNATESGKAQNRRVEFRKL
ncbi:hypothetical protein GCM10027051_01380 [Niabella terrae]